MNTHTHTTDMVNKTHLPKIMFCIHHNFPPLKYIFNTRLGTLEILTRYGSHLQRQDFTALQHGAVLPKTQVVDLLVRVCRLRHLHHPVGRSERDHGQHPAGKRQQNLPQPAQRLRKLVFHALLRSQGHLFFLVLTRQIIRKQIAIMTSLRFTHARVIMIALSIATVVVANR